MKYLFTIALSLFISTSAFAAPKFTKLVRINADPSMFGGISIRGGNLVVDPDQRSAALTLHTEKRCGPHEFCTQQMPAPFVIRLPLVSRYTDSCNAVVYIARVDRRPADGLLEMLRIVDNSMNRCQTTRILDAVEISYETEAFSRRGKISTYSTFAGKPFISAEY